MKGKGSCMEKTNLKNITNSKVPVILRNCLKWSILDWTLEKWKSFLELDDTKKIFSFRKGSKHCSEEPLWERKCETVEMTMNDFIEKHLKGEGSDEWLYFDYKHIEEWFKAKAELLEISWEQFGYPDKTARDSTLWIGTKGAHTPCHIDTYGRNLVAQLYGRKKWYLFPPSESSNLKPTRIPYEESSIYSNINFSCGCDHINISKIEDVRVIELNPGDVLFVPHHWWHYVENLSSAISINIWLPTECDSICRLEESLVKYFISSVCRSIDASDMSEILNPNEDDIPFLKENDNIDELLWCINHSNSSTCDQSKACCIDPTIEAPHMSSQEFSIMLKTNCAQEPSSSVSDNPERDKSSFRMELIKAFCHPDVITLVREKLLNYLE